MAGPGQCLARSFARPNGGAGARSCQRTTQWAAAPGVLRSRPEPLLQFDPPAFAVPPSLRWALVRAFGPVGQAWPAPPAGREALDLARRFDLAARIGGRHPLPSLAAEVGAQAASAFTLEHEAARRAAAFLGKVAAEVAGVAASLGVPIVLLKFAALRASGLVADGLRAAGDVDVLAPPDRARALAAALGTLGLTPAGFGAEAHQLPQLRDGGGRCVEVHVHVPEVRVSPGAPPVTLDALASRGLLRRTGLPGECSVPLPHVMTAHAVVHGLVHHGFAPDGYPALRLVGDLIALGAHEDGGALACAALTLVVDEIGPDEMEAAVALAARLARADATLFEPGPSPEATLLRHVVAGRLDVDYGRSLRLRAVGARRWTLARAAHALVLTDAQIDVVYGPPRSRLGYMGRRLARPFDLVRRIVRYAAAAARVRLRR